MPSNIRNSEAERFQRRFWKQAVSSLPGNLTIRIYAKINGRKRTASTPAWLKHAVVKPYSLDSVANYHSLLKHTKLWHGTGKFQYVNNTIVDVLDVIIKQNALNPTKDPYAILIGGKEVVSLSTTRLRIIARSYADTHGQGEREQNRYGSSLRWVSYYYSAFYLTYFTKFSLVALRNWRQWKRASTSPVGGLAWGKKVNKTAVSVWDVFGSGSDIKHNYPVLFGIKQYDNTITLPKSLASYEVRITKPVTLDDISLIEVPARNVSEVRQKVQASGYDIPVVPMELGEFVASQQPFTTLLGWT